MRVLPVLLILWSAPALAQDYPFTGTFVSAGSADGPSPDDPARCALSFFRQDKSGDFVNYVVDLPTFNATQTLRYKVNSRGNCSFDPVHRIEACKTSFDLNPANVGSVYHDVIDQIAPDFIRLSNFDTKAAALDYAMTGSSASGQPAGFYRCAFEAARLSAAVSDDTATLTADQAQALLGPDQAQLHAPIVAALLKAAGLSAP